MTQPIAPGRGYVLATAFAKRALRIARHASPAISALHDAQPGIRSTGDGPSGRGGHSDPTGDMACNDHPDPARAVLDEVTALFTTVDTASARLDHLLRNWAGPSQKWRKALATEAAAKLNDEHNWCAAHQQAGLLEPARTPGSRLCQRCQLDRGEIGADPPVWMIEKRHRGRSITTIDMATAKREAKATRKRKR